MITPTGLHYWDKISIGADMEPEDNIQNCLQVLKEEVVKFQQKTISENESINIRQVNKIISSEKTMIEEMQSCTFLDREAGGLLSFELTFKTAEEKVVYADMLKRLTKNKK